MCDQDGDKSILSVQFPANTTSHVGIGSEPFCIDKVCTTRKVGPYLSLFEALEDEIANAEDSTETLEKQPFYCSFGKVSIGVFHREVTGIMVCEIMLDSGLENRQEPKVSVNGTVKIPVNQFDLVATDKTQQLEESPEIELDQVQVFSL